MKVKRGMPFVETFTINLEGGGPMNLSNAKIKFIVENGLFAREYVPGNGLRVSATSGIIYLGLSSEQTNEFAFNELLYTLVVNGSKIARGIMEVEN